jgi:hypothetical protein
MVIQRKQEVKYVTDILEQINDESRILAQSHDYDPKWSKHVVTPYTNKRTLIHHYCFTCFENDR